MFKTAFCDEIIELVNPSGAGSVGVCMCMIVCATVSDDGPWESQPNPAGQSAQVNVCSCTAVYPHHSGKMYSVCVSAFACVTECRLKINVCGPAVGKTHNIHQHLVRAFGSVVLFLCTDIVVISQHEQTQGQRFVSQGAVCL